LAAPWGIVGRNLSLAVEMDEKLMESKLVDEQVEKSEFVNSFIYYYANRWYGTKPTKTKTGIQVETTDTNKNV